MRVRLVWTLVASLAIGVTSGPAIGGPAGCPIAEGAGIAGVQIGMPVAAAMAVTGPAARQQSAGNQVVFTLAAPWAQMIVENGVVVRVSTRSPVCRSARGVGPGSALSNVHQAYASTAISTTTQTADGQILAFPFLGVAFTVKGTRVDAVDVYRADSLGPSGPVRSIPAPGVSPTRGAGPPAQPSPTPTTAPGTWSVRSTSTRIDGNTLVVSGTVENRSRALSAYAEVQLVGGGQGDAPLQPNPVPAGGTGTFEVRIPIDRLVQRYTVVIHPLGSPTVVLARAAGEIKDTQQFAAMVTRTLQVDVRSTAPTAGPEGFAVVVNNSSSLTIESVTVSAQLNVTCRVARGPGGVLVAAATGVVPAAPPTSPPTPPPTPRPTFAPSPSLRTIQETWTGTVTVRQIGPASSGQAPLQLSGGVCLTFTSWSATTQITDVRLPR